MPIRRVLVATTLTALASHAAADGMPLKDGRFVGRVIVVRLTDPQRKELDAAARWRQAHGLDWPPESEWPEVERDGLALTPDQRARVRALAGAGPRRVSVVETRLGQNDCTCGACNRALRFDELHVEIPLEYVIADAACRRLDAEVHGPRPGAEARSEVPSSCPRR